MSQSIFEKYLIWNNRLNCINKLCCEIFSDQKMNRLKKIQWSLICSVNEIENGQRKAVSILATKKVELLCAKDGNMKYINNTADWTNSKLMDEVDKIDGTKYSDWKELMKFAYDLVKL